MGRIEIQTHVHAPIERCFDLSRNVDLHIQSATGTSERAIAGVTSGMVKKGDTVTWEAKHFGINFRMTVAITEMIPPNSFRDSQVSGPFHSFDHDHIFEVTPRGTLITDIFVFKCPYGLLGSLVDKLVENHLRKFLIERNRVLKEVAEKP